MIIEMTEAVRSMTKTKAVGPDSLPVGVFKLDHPGIPQHFHSNLFAELREGEVPQ